MDYKKTVWFNGKNPALTAQRLNNIENGIEKSFEKITDHAENEVVHVTEGQKKIWTPIGGVSFVIDAISGNDDNLGTSNNPFKTFAPIATILDKRTIYGDVVIFLVDNGSYDPAPIRNISFHIAGRLSIRIIKNNDSKPVLSSGIWFLFATIGSLRIEDINFSFETISLNGRIGEFKISNCDFAGVNNTAISCESIKGEIEFCTISSKLGLLTANSGAVVSVNNCSGSVNQSAVTNNGSIVMYTDNTITAGSTLLAKTKGGQNFTS